MCLINSVGLGGAQILDSFRAYGGVLGRIEAFAYTTSMAMFRYILLLVPIIGAPIIVGSAYQKARVKSAC